jgi:signal transduction histidine kinase
VAKGNKTVLRVTIVQLICVVVFLLFLELANLANITNSTYSQVIGFLNQNLVTIMIFSLLLYFGELFFVFRFPLNFLVPIFNASGAVFLVAFILRVVYLIGEVSNQKSFLALKSIELETFILVFIIVVIVGYVRIVKYNKEAKNKNIELEKPKKEQTEEPKKEQEEELKKEQTQEPKKEQKKK